ncbi:unnamed protein product [Cochlearia groenlandica]
MKMLNSYHTLLLLANIALLVLAFVVPLKAQDTPQDYLNAHNIARATEPRAAVGVDPLVWDETVAEYARDHASKQQGNDCAMEHSQGGPYGENIAWSSGDMSGVDAVNMWVKEIDDYDYSSNTCTKECGHYTQVVWKNTLRVGCAKVTCNNGATFITCNYDPAGNFVGEWPY